MSNAITFEATNDEYHARSEVSNSTCSVYDRDPAEYEGRFITKTIEPRKSDAFNFGNIWHEVCECKDGIGENIAIVPLQFIVDGKVPEPLPEGAIEIPSHCLSASGSKAGKAWKSFKESQDPEAILIKPYEWRAATEYQNWLVENSDKVAVTSDDYKHILQMMESVHKHKTAFELLNVAKNKAQVETNIKWTDDQTGVECRARLDLFEPSLRATDIKSSKSAKPGEFVRDALKYGYHRQRVWYRTAIFELTGEWIPFYYVVTEKAPPYTTEVFEFDDDMDEIAHTSIRSILKGIAACQESGIWRRQSFGKIVKLSAPRWAHTNLEWQV